ncbi:hypothetical protein B0A53_02432 [Rhodotorula sp. CCFEE 5036]|nr:hypothetical protein B0A53_02432 [Rhodotorula sp. CCFEE 5036]
MAVREPARAREDPNDPSPSLPDDASISRAQTFGSPSDGTRTHSDDTLRNTTSSKEADDRPQTGLSSLADIESALPNSKLAGARRSRPTGLAIAPASPPVAVGDFPAGFFYIEKGGSAEAVERRAAVPERCESRSEKTSSKLKGPSSAPRRSGVCKFFNAQKGFGFVLDDAADELGDVEVFVHYTTISSVKGGPNGFKSLLEGEPVEYSIVQGPKGWQAQEVTGPGGAPCIGSPPQGGGAQSPSRPKQVDTRRRSEAEPLSNRPPSLVPREPTSAPAPQPKSRSRSFAERQAQSEVAYVTDGRVGPVVRDGYLSAPEGYRSVTIHPYAMSPATPQYMYSEFPASAFETLYHAYASYHEPRPSQVPPFYASHNAVLVPSPPLAFSPTHSYFPSYEPGYPTFTAAPADLSYFYASHHPYPQYPPYGPAEESSPEAQRPTYPISSNVS